uniref:Uncharacterized protein n=1 Tax=viral metagenome TaxID=1070528 RepID=A0A6H1ZWI8_9ZZZZ
MKQLSLLSGKMEKTMTHDELVSRAKKWLKNTFHCRVVLSELVAYTMSGETPDAIGWINGRSILVECKATKNDFKADEKKRSRLNGMPALGDWRFYLTPPGLIVKPKDGWGLYEVHGRRIIYISGEKYTNCGQSPFESDKGSEIAMLVSALARMSITRKSCSKSSLY